MELEHETGVSHLMRVLGTDHMVLWRITKRS